MQARPTQASFVIKVRVCKVKVAVKFSVVEFDSHGVVSVLINCPNKPY